MSEFLRVEVESLQPSNEDLNDQNSANNEETLLNEEKQNEKEILSIAKSQPQTRSQRRKFEEARRKTDGKRKNEIKRDLWKLSSLETFEFDIQFEVGAIINLAQQYPEAFQEYDDETPRNDPVAFLWVSRSEPKKQFIEKTKRDNSDETKRTKRKRGANNDESGLNSNDEDAFANQSIGLKPGGVARRTSSTTEYDYISDCKNNKVAKRNRKTSTALPRIEDLPFSGIIYESVVFNEDDFLTFEEFARRTKTNINHDEKEK
uniref:Uncharacterized protein n=1 Tax=Aureoumbra lagunensis TaxID=44058 RepID=A0A7S3NM10_9STRA|mmetsp:Transcript_8540/g.11883  ORF Transcript_8540/g.11883 Transcript_8540/m.11883 type:complete len:261 (+) Transcript_8540:26-808(+)